jgi:hypothetical protein
MQKVKKDAPQRGNLCYTENHMKKMGNAVFMQSETRPKGEGGTV